MKGWFTTKETLPIEGIVVQAMDSGGHIQHLVRRGNLWFFPDMSMYVYYVPKFWRIDPEAIAFSKKTMKITTGESD